MIKEINNGDVFENEIFRIIIYNVDKNEDRVWYGYRRKDEIIIINIVSDNIYLFIKNLNIFYKLINTRYDEEIL